MWRPIALGVGGLVLASIALWMVLVVSMRTKFRPVLNAVRWINRTLLNPHMIDTAGQPGAYASVVHHVGRITGTRYKTPVGAERTNDGFVIALPYGTGVDWLRNVLAAGSATIKHEGTTYRVDHPELVSAARARHHFPPTEQRRQRLYGVRDFLLIRLAELP